MSKPCVCPARRHGSPRRFPFPESWVTSVLHPLTDFEDRRMVEERNIDVQVPNARGFSPSPATSRRPGPAAEPRRGNNRKRVLLVLQYYDYRHHSGVAKYAAE